MTREKRKEKQRGRNVALKKRKKREEKGRGRKETWGNER